MLSPLCLYDHELPCTYASPSKLLGTASVALGGCCRGGRGTKFKFRDPPGAADLLLFQTVFQPQASRLEPVFFHRRLE